MSTVIGLAIVIIFSVLVSLDNTLDKESREKAKRIGELYYVLTLQIVIFLALTASITQLFIKLKQ